MERGHRGRQRRDALGEFARLFGVKPELGAGAQIRGTRQASAAPLEGVELLDDAARLACESLHLDGPELASARGPLLRLVAGGQRGLEARENAARRRGPLGARAQPLDDLLAAGSRARARARRAGAEPAERGHQRLHALERHPSKGSFPGPALRRELGGQEADGLVVGRARRGAPPGGSPAERGPAGQTEICRERGEIEPGAPVKARARVERCPSKNSAAPRRSTMHLHGGAARVASRHGTERLGRLGGQRRGHTLLGQAGSGTGRPSFGTRPRGSCPARSPAARCHPTRRGRTRRRTAPHRRRRRPAQRAPACTGTRFMKARHPSSAKAVRSLSS